MSIRDAVALGISPERAALNADFFESYANTTLAELRTIDPDEGRRDGVSREDEEWTLTVDAATAFREAAHWASVLEPSRATRLLETAGALFLDTENMIGIYLMRVAGATPPSRFDVAARVEMLRPPSTVGGPYIEESPVLIYPQQQAYLLLELASENDPAAVGRVREICAQSLHRTGAAPVGSLGAPIRHFWIMADALATADLSTFFDHYLEAFRDRLRSALQSARSNTWLWEHGATGVDVIDPDALGAAALAARRFGIEDVLAVGERRLAQDDAVALAAVFRLGVELTGRES